MKPTEAQGSLELTVYNRMSFCLSLPGCIPPHVAFKGQCTEWIYSYILESDWWVGSIPEVPPRYLSFCASAKFVAPTSDSHTSHEPQLESLFWVDAKVFVFFCSVFAPNCHCKPG